MPGEHRTPADAADRDVAALRFQRIKKGILRDQHRPLLIAPRLFFSLSFPFAKPSVDLAATST
jgi:hypothetical protein